VDIIRRVGFPAKGIEERIRGDRRTARRAAEALWRSGLCAPLRIVADTPRPLDADDLPIDAVQTPEERDLAATLPARFYAAGGLHPGQLEDASGGREPTLMPRPTSLRALAGRILGQTGD